MEGMERIRETIFHAASSSCHSDLITAVTHYQQQLVDENKIRNSSDLDGAGAPVDVDEEIKKLLNAEYEGFGNEKVELLLNMAVNLNNEQMVQDL